MTYWKVFAEQHSRDSGQLETTFALYNQDTVQTNEPTSFSLPNTTVKR